MPLRPRLEWMLLLVMAWGSTSMAQAPQSRSVTPLSPAGVVFLIDGVGGFGFGAKMMEVAFADAGIPHELRRFHWSHGFGRWHDDLTDDENIRRKAAELADQIMKLRIGEPERPIYIVAKSGGTAIALTALAQLPADTVERAVLLSPAVSPKFDLLPALSAVRSVLASFWSPNDKMILGLGTTVFGTVDGMYCASAGMTGFAIPEDASDADRAQYHKLRQVEWEVEMRKTYNYGTHLGTSMPQFVRHYVAPLLAAR